MFLMSSSSDGDIYRPNKLLPYGQVPVKGDTVRYARVKISMGTTDTFLFFVDNGTGGGALNGLIGSDRDTPQLKQPIETKKLNYTY